MKSNFDYEQAVRSILQAEPLLEFSVLVGRRVLGTEKPDSNWGMAMQWFRSLEWFRFALALAKCWIVSLMRCSPLKPLRPKWQVIYSTRLTRKYCND